MVAIQKGRVSRRREFGAARQTSTPQTLWEGAKCVNRLEKVGVETIGESEVGGEEGRGVRDGVA